MRHIAVAVLLLFVTFLLYACQTGAKQPMITQVEAASVPTPTLLPAITPTEPVPTAAAEKVEPVQLQEPIEMPALSAGEPAGCLSLEQQEKMVSSQEMLAHADSLLKLNQPLAKRKLSASWNAVENRYFHQAKDVFSLAVSDLKSDYALQKILNALHISGFAAWLRESPEQGLHILAIALLDPDWEQGQWERYIRSYWQDRQAVPEGDPFVKPALKLPPCRWMVEGGFSPPVHVDWWESDSMGWPDYTRTVASYLASNTADANQVAQKIDWLGSGGKEAANTMCGPLVWALMNDASAFPPGAGGWLGSPKSFWLAKPSQNGRPWSLFPPESYQVYHFEKPLGMFNFGRWPLYPGDFLYTYSQGDGFDHMVLVTEVDENGNVWIITNREWMLPERMLTIERVILANLNDPAVGVGKNEWHADRQNGRTGHAGFDVFRWAWMEKDILREPAAYTVQPGDTLGLVAARWRTPADLIARYNDMEIDEALTIGLELQIPPNEGEPWK
jgi:hypothetical protein